jgi:hypothetical protein
MKVEDKGRSCTLEGHVEAWAHGPSVSENNVPETR